MATRDAIHSFRKNEPNIHKIYNVAFVEQWLRERVRVCGVHLDRFLLKSQLATRDAIYGDDCTFNLARERGAENGGTIYIFRLPPTATDARMR